MRKAIYLFGGTGNTFGVIPVQAYPRDYASMTIGQRIRDLREARGWGQDTFAEMVGVSQETVSRWETGERGPKRTRLPKLAEIFGVSVAELLGDAPPAVQVEVNSVPMMVALPSSEILTEMFESMLRIALSERGLRKQAELCALLFPAHFRVATSAQDERAIGQPQTPEWRDLAGAEDRQ